MRTKPKLREIGASKRGRSKLGHSKLGASIIAGLNQALAHSRGEIELRAVTYHIPDPVDVKQVRRKLGLSQGQFAAYYGFNPRTLQEWEQGRSKPDLAARAYLTVIERDHEAVEKALSATE